MQAYESWKKVLREAKCVWKDKTIQYQTTQGGYDYVNQTYDVLQCNSVKTLDIVQKMDACNTLTTEICDLVFKRFQVCLDQMAFNLTFFIKKMQYNC